MVAVKVCGIKSADELSFLRKLPVDAVGFICGATHKTEDEVDPLFVRTAKEILPPFTKRVLVSHLTDHKRMSEIIATSRVDALQLQGNVSVDSIRVLKESFPYLTIIKAIHVLGYDSIKTARKYEGVVDALLLDSRTANRLGGTGRTHDWNISREIVNRVSVPVILAGGLCGENVEEAIKTVQPYGVDANSRLKGENGYKDEEKVKEFVEKAKGIKI